MEVATRTPDRIRPGESEAGRFYDEAFDAGGRPRPHYERLIRTLQELDLRELAARTHADPAARAVTFRVEDETRRFHLDPVPRIVEAGEWARLEAGLAQRARALNAFIADAYGERRIVAAGVMPDRVIDSCEYFEPWMIHVHVPHGHATVTGFDVVRCADGRLRVLEDNLRTPSGFAYASAARRVVDAQLPAAAQSPKRDVDTCFAMLSHALRPAAPGRERDANIVLLTDGTDNSAWYEHRTLARRMNVAVVGPRDLRTRNGRLYQALPSGRLREIQVVYRRTDEDRLSDARARPTWLAELLLEPIRRGTVAVLNAPGSGVADDKLVHAYVEDMVRFYLGQEPLVESVRTYDLGRQDERTRALGRLGALVVKPRAGYGGQGVVICGHASDTDRELAAAAIRAEPERFVAQELVALSRHPTICDGRLEPRHVDLRVFAIASDQTVRVVPGGLTRVALERGSLIVNSSQNGGGKDTWVLA